MENTYASPINACKVLAVSSTPDVLALVRRLADADFSAPLRLPENEQVPPLELRYCDLNYGAVATVAREQQTEPFGVVIIELPFGQESTAEQIVRALYHTDLNLHILALMGEGAVAGKALMDVMEQSSRVAWMPMPRLPDELNQYVKLMAAKWTGDRQAAIRCDRVPAEAERDVSASGNEPGSSTQNLHLAAIGSMAAGIAHEFNNFLTVVQSQLAIGIDHARTPKEIVTLLTEVVESAHQASQLSRKLSSLTAETASGPAAFSLNELLEQEVGLLRKTLGEAIVLEVDKGHDLPSAWADSGLVGQAMTNIALHAKSEMPVGGTLQFSTRKIEVGPGGRFSEVFPSTAAGSYLLLMIEDPNPKRRTQECGADPWANVRLEWLRQALASSGGAFRASIAPGVSLLYQVLLPIAEKPDAMEKLPKSITPPQKAAPSTILVVDDDETICAVMTQVLSNAEHRVIVATNADQGWTQWRQHHGTIKLLITDINMPGGANGVALGQAVQDEDATVPVIYTSGYRSTAQYGNLIPGINYLPKPFGMNDLLSVVSRNLLTHTRHGLA